MVDIRHSYGEARHVLRTLFPKPFLNWREARFYGRYGEVELHLLKLLCRPDEDAIDVGANDGAYVHYMRRYARRVIAYEPIPRLARALREKFHGRVIVEDIALSDCTGRIELHVPVIDGVLVDGCSTVSSGASGTYSAHQGVEVPRDRLDNVYRGHVGFIKIDVEGHEQAVLDGAQQTIERNRPRLLVQIDERLSPGGLERARAYFADLKYVGYFVHNYHIKPIERFSVDRMQHPANVPDLMAPLHSRERFGRYVYNFIFLPAEEPQRMMVEIMQRLDRLRDRLTG